VNELLDLSDLAYAHMAEIVSGEPLDNDGPLLTIAFVPSTSTTGADVDGMGLIGRKGVEINPRTLDTFKAYLAAGNVPDRSCTSWPTTSTSTTYGSPTATTGRTPGPAS
jgi:hypothetical protein